MRKLVADRIEASLNKVLGKGAGTVGNTESSINDAAAVVPSNDK